MSAGLLLPSARSLWARPFDENTIFDFIPVSFSKASIKGLIKKG